MFLRQKRGNTVFKNPRSPKHIDYWRFFMRIRNIVAASLTVVVLLSGCAKKPSDFRGANWGDSLQKVLKSEDSDYLFASDELLMFKTTMNSEPIEIYYSFAENQLTEAQVKFIIGDRILRDLVESYDNMAAFIAETYGKPLNEDKLVWNDEDPAFQADAHWVSILNYRLIYLLEWETETTYIKLLLECPDMKNITYIYYACPVSR